MPLQAEDASAIRHAARESETHDSSGLVRFNLAALRSGWRLNLIDGDLEHAQELTTRAVKSFASAVGGYGAQQLTFDEPRINRLMRELEGSSKPGRASATPTSRQKPAHWCVPRFSPPPLRG